MARLMLFCLMVFAPAVALAVEKLALVIGNADYQESPLKNPVNDARAVSKRLATFGFEVIEAYDQDLAGMQAAVLQFTSQLEASSTALVFYAGHGVQANGRNYLMPIEARLTSEQALRFQALELNDVLEELERARAKINIVILDACRNNPFERKFRGGSRGLAVVDAAQGTLIAYATAPGSIAADGDGKHGLYTQALLDALDKPGLQVEEVFKDVRRKVSRASGGLQVPWESSSLTGNFVFNGSAGAPATSLALDSDAAELLFWQSIAESDKAADFADYLSRYPEGEFTSIANRRALELAARETTCADLSGRWFARIKGDEDPVCRDTFTIERLDGTDNRYNVNYDVCSELGAVTNIRGQAEFADQKLTYRWKSPPCNGVTRYELDATCGKGTGQIIKRGGLLGFCNLIVDKSVVVEVEKDS